jgi:hypothetical protein
MLGAIHDAKHRGDTLIRLLDCFLLHLDGFDLFSVFLLDTGAQSFRETLGDFAAERIGCEFGLPLRSGIVGIGGAALSRWQGFGLPGLFGYYLPSVRHHKLPFLFPFLEKILGTFPGVRHR